MGSLEYGARQAVRCCLRVEAGEEAVLITDRETAEIADALEGELRQAGARVSRFVMEEFGERPEDGSAPLALPAVVAEKLRAASTSLYAATGKRGELQSFRTPMLQLVGSLHRLKHAHMPGVTRQIMEMGMSADYEEVQRRNRLVYETVCRASAIRVTSPAGTDFTVRFHPDWKWVNSDGAITPGNWKNLPDGEVFTCARTADGVAVVDGCLGDYFQREGSLENNPVTVAFAGGVVTGISCAGRPDIAEDLLQYIRQDENAHRIGEFAIGTNPGLDRIIGNLLQDEKFPGVHIALGHGCPNKTGAPWNSSAHVDAVLRCVTIEVDGTAIMRDGVFLID